MAFPHPESRKDNHGKVDKPEIGEVWQSLRWRTVDVAGQIAGNEHEELGSIAESVVAKRQPGYDVVRNVIEENHPQPQATKEIEPKVTLDSLRERNFVVCHQAGPSCLVERRTQVLGAPQYNNAKIKA